MNYCALLLGFFFLYCHENTYSYPFNIIQMIFCNWRASDLGKTKVLPSSRGRWRQDFVKSLDEINIFCIFAVRNILTEWKQNLTNRFLLQRALSSVILLGRESNGSASKMRMRLFRTSRRGRCASC